MFLAYRQPHAPQLPPASRRRPRAAAFRPALEALETRWLPSAWAPTTPVTTASLRAVWATGTSEVFAVGTGGTVLHSTDDGATWAVQTLTAATDLRGVWGTGPNNIFAVGTSGIDGVILHSGDDGVTWTTQFTTNALLFFQFDSLEGVW